MLTSETLFVAKRFRVVRLSQAMPDGTVHYREVVRHPGAVTILPVASDERICFVRNYRAAVDEVLVELPAGTLEPGEEPFECARRELAEETGYRAGRLQLMTTFYMSPGVLDERMHLYLATQLTAGPTSLDAGEQIEPLLATWDEALEMARDGRIRDSKTLAGLLYFGTFLRR